MAKTKILIFSDFLQDLAAGEQEVNEIRTREKSCVQIA